MAAVERIAVEVVYALADRQTLIGLKLDDGSTALEAIERSGVLTRHPQIDLMRDKIGIHGRLCAPSARLRDGDRVEIYRELQADAKEIRRKRAVAGKPLRAKPRKRTF